MSWNITKTREKIRDKGLRATTPRIVVLQFFSERDRPISHGDLVSELSDLHGDQATIYRTLITFTEVGLLRVASKAEGIARYELVTENDDPHHVHPHFVCKECGIVSCLPETTFVSTMDETWKEILKASELQFIGQCITCRTL